MGWTRLVTGSEGTCRGAARTERDAAGRFAKEQSVNWLFAWSGSDSGIGRVVYGARTYACQGATNAAVSLTCQPVP